MVRVVTLAFALAAAAALNACSPQAVSVVAPPDHSHPDEFRATSDRRFDDANHWAKIFDSPERAAWQRPEELLTAIKLQPGMRVADLGAGTGFFLPYLSRTVGEEGRVFAVEVEPALVTHMRERVARAGLDNVEVLLSAADSLDLPPASIDMLLLIDVYHHIDHRLAYLKDARASLASQGTIVVVDWKPGDLPVGPRDPHHKLPPEQVIRELDAAGFRLVPTSDVLPYQYVLVFTERDPRLSP
jgi:ubiquinone/menaquinone biosynthesis C-methylase UbiE